MWTHAFAGGGVAACVTALRLIEDGERGILLVDRKDDDPRTLAYWTDRPVPFDAIEEHRWSTLRIVGPDRVVERPLDGWRYATIRVSALRAKAYEAIEAAGGRVVRAEVDAVADGGDHATLRAGGEDHRALWVYDSRHPDLPAPELFQSFVGWWIETTRDAFDPGVATLMDFRVPQEPDGLRFFHVLPVSPRRALVTGVDLAPAIRFADVSACVDRLVGGAEWRLDREERGVTAMTGRTFARREGRRVLAIGLRGGRLKPSTGYALVRIGEDAERIASSLRRDGHPFARAASDRVWRLLDAVLIEVVRRRGPETGAIFAALFERNPIGRVLRFLDERAGLADVVRLVWSMPRWGWFLAALLRLVLASLSPGAQERTPPCAN